MMNNEPNCCWRACLIGMAARPSRTEAIYKIYAQSFRSGEHLKQIQRDAQTAFARFLEASGLGNHHQT